MGTRTLGELIEMIHAEGTVTPAMQAIVTYAERLSAAARTHGNALIAEAGAYTPVGRTATVG